MSKILDTNYITTYTPRMIELRKGFIINGQYYLKDNMQPIPFNFVTYNNNYLTYDGTSSLILDRRISYNQHCTESTFGEHSGVLFDSEDERVTYVLTKAYSYHYLIKYQEENNRCKQVAVYTLTSSNYYAFPLTITETDEGIEVYMTGQAFTSTINIFNKNDLSLIRSYTTTGLSHSTSYQYDSESVISGDFRYKAGYGDNRFTFYSRKSSAMKYQKVEDPSSSDSSNYRNRLHYNGPWEESDREVSAIYPVSSSASAAGYIAKMIHVKYDKETELYNTKEIKVIAGNPDTVGHDTNTYFATTSGWNSDIFYKTISGKRYMFIYNRHSYNVTSSRMMVFKYKEITEEENENVFELIKIQSFPTGQSGRIIHFMDEKKLRFYGSVRSSSSASATFSSVYCYELDESTLEFVKTFNVDGVIREFGFDKDRNLYVYWSDNSVSKYNEKTASNFNARFEEGLYEYQGEDIKTNLVISTTNLQGDYLAKEVKLDIKGNAKFKENGLKSITVNTKTDKELNIPVIITGAGSLNIFPKIKA